MELSAVLSVNCTSSAVIRCIILLCFILKRFRSADTFIASLPFVTGTHRVIVLANHKLFSCFMLLTCDAYLSCWLQNARMARIPSKH